MRLVHALILLTGLTGHIMASKEVQFSKENKKMQKQLSLFSVVTFPNDACTAKSDATTKGTCYTSTECSNKKGVKDGNCASGFGVCCTFTLSASGTTATENCTYIQNPTYPSKYATAGTLTYSVTPKSTDICNLFLDFTNFDITETTAGVCTDSFLATGASGQNPTTLCGTLTGQHLYVSTGRSTTAATLKFTIVTGGTWKIRVCQIECHSMSNPPTDCDTWQTGVSGAVTSYNWKGKVQLANTDYVHCVRREKGFCAIQWTASSSTSPSGWTVDGSDTVAKAGSSAAVTAAAGAWVTLPSAFLADAYTGKYFNSKITLTAASDAAANGKVIVGPGHVFRVTQGASTNLASADIGFSLIYVQMAC